MAEGQIAEKIGIRVAENRGTAKWDDGIMMEQEKHISQFNNRKWKIEEKTWQQSINKVWKNADTYQEKEGTGKFGQKSSAKLVLNVQLRSKFVHLACKQLQLILAIGRQKTDATNWIRNGTNRVRCQKRPEEKKPKRRRVDKKQKGERDEIEIETKRLWAGREIAIGLVRRKEVIDANERTARELRDQR